MHTGPAPLPRAGTGGEEEEEEEDGLRQHLSSSGWFRRLGRRTGTPPALGISGTTAEKRGGGEGVTAPHPTPVSHQPQSAKPHMLQRPPQPRGAASPP